jgi:hypothetical protein
MHRCIFVAPTALAASAAAFPGAYAWTMEITSLAVQTLILIVATLALCGHGVWEARMAKMRGQVRDAAAEHGRECAAGLLG